MSKNHQLINTITQPKDTKKILGCLRDNGICLIENYYDQEKCDSIRRSCIERAEVDEDLNYPDGSYRRFDVYKNTGAAANKRVFHVDCFNSEAAILKNDEFIKNIAKAYYNNNNEYSVHVQVYERHQFYHIPVRGFHIDTFETSTFKAMMYLNDVNSNDGPNSYIIGTHKDTELRRKKEFDWGPSVGDDFDNTFKPHPTNFTRNELGPLINNWVKITANKGALILFDTWGVHCGISPAEDGDRHSITNYYRPGKNLPRSDFGFNPDKDYKKYFVKST